MFILINNIPYNSYAISSFNKGTDVKTESTGEDVIVYCINFQLNSGNVLKEEYSSEEERNTAYNNLLERLTK